MKFFLNIILFYLIIFNINSLNTNHLCKRKIQSLNKQNIEKKVEILKCPKYFSFTCSSNYCTKNNKTCESIKNLHYMIRAYSGLVLFEKELNRYFKFIKMISNCSTIKTSKLKV
jgi:hypothetical protein